MLVAILITALLNDKFISAYNMQNLIKWSTLYAVMSIGVAFVIITGGIVCIGSSCLVAVVLAFQLKVKGIDQGRPSLPRCACLLGGLIHGLLITKAKIQPFVVTLCGLLIYRSLGQWLTDNQSLGPVPLEDDKGYANIDTINSSIKYLVEKLPSPIPSAFHSGVIFILLGIAAALFLNRTIWGRYLFALGNNEDGAR